jgi:hypothetical protein
LLRVSEWLTVIPLIQHFLSYDGNTVNKTAFRLIAMQALPKKVWLKLDAKVPVYWHHNEAIPASAELQWTKMFSPKWGGRLRMVWSVSVQTDLTIMALALVCGGCFKCGKLNRKKPSRLLWL